jgi:hypothetical protein
MNIGIEGLRYCGHGLGFDDIIIEGDPAELKVSCITSMKLSPVVS